ncbi:MAG: MBOAT family protein [Saprospiraceae bacterium]|nr:MBOAT family protein [Saprospiraceae bacterium]
MMLQEINWTDIAQHLFVYDPKRPLLFNSAAFLALFIVLYALFIPMRRATTWRTWYLLLFSIFFYYKSSGLFFILLLLSTGWNFGLGHLMHTAGSRASRIFYLFLSVGGSLGLLAYYKYTNFFIGSVNALAGTEFAFQKIFLPVGISFFTFQTLSYTIDVYRGTLKPISEGARTAGDWLQSFADFAFYVSFFPQLVAGPIVRAADFIPQIRQPLKLSKENVGYALLLISGGLFKKAVISDYISVNFVDRIFANPGLYSGFENLMGVYGYAIQIYCDFSGYSDMAIGLALLFGFQLAENFRSPYKAVSVQDFWQRWHISLSTWLRDYLYISLGGNKKGKFRTYLNLMITMLLGGLWHGANWVFIIWGALHGAALAIDRFLKNLGRIWENPAMRAFLIMLIIQGGCQIAVWRIYAAGDLDELEYADLLNGNLLVAGVWFGLMLLAIAIDKLVKKSTASRIAAGIMVFHFVCFCWIFFRSGAPGSRVPPMETTFKMLYQIMAVFRPEVMGQVIAGYWKAMLLIGTGFLIHLLPGSWDRSLEKGYARMPAVVKAVGLALIIWIVIQTSSAEVTPFIYFQF